MHSDQLDYELPPDRIAVTPAEPRDDARLLVVRRAQDQLEHHRVRDLPQLLEPGDLVIVNQSRVLPAYLQGVRRETGGKVSGLFLAQAEDHHWHIMIESRGKLIEGEFIDLDKQTSLHLIDRDDTGCWLARLDSDQNTMTVLERLGQTPLPPYIRKARRTLGLEEVLAQDAERYNTVYAARHGSQDAAENASDEDSVSGSVAAPTAGLHFTPSLLDQFEAKGIGWSQITLHVGIGTFAPIRTAQLDDHQMHCEWFNVPAQCLTMIQHTRRHGGRIVPIGTTTVRALESLPDSWEPLIDRGYAGKTELFIRPDNYADGSHKPWSFRFTDALMTNFHLPRSTLLAMVAALPHVGLTRLKSWYLSAIENEYRFYSYGDAMLLL